MNKEEKQVVYAAHDAIDIVRSNIDKAMQIISSVETAANNLEKECWLLNSSIENNDARIIPLSKDVKGDTEELLHKFIKAKNELYELLYSPK